MSVDRDTAKALREKGKTYREIGIVFGVSRQRIHQVLMHYTSKQRHPRVSKLGRIEGETELQYTKRWRAATKIVVIKYYGKGKLECVRCGFNDIRALTIDHINGKGHKHRNALPGSSSQFYRWLIKNNFPKGYQTLCMNCQWIKRAENYEYYTKQSPLTSGS